MLHMIPSFPAAELPSMTEVCAGLGQSTHGTLCNTGMFHQSAVVEIGAGLSFEEAATLGCSGLTAWNALMGMKGREVRRGDWILVQGTGGVSIAALQVCAPLRLFFRTGRGANPMVDCTCGWRHCDSDNQLRGQGIALARSWSPSYSKLS